jgi:hypothetical protein
VRENNTNKNLIISMSIKQKFRQPKKKKRKRDPKIHVNSNEGSLKELKRCFKVFLCCLSIEIPYYKEGHVDEVKIIKSSDFKSLSNHPQTETPSRTLFGSARQCPTLPKKAPSTHRESQPDNIQSIQTMSVSPLGLCPDFESCPNG